MATCRHLHHQMAMRTNLLLLLLLLLLLSSLSSTCWLSNIISHHSVTALTTTRGHQIVKSPSYYPSPSALHHTADTPTEYWAQYSLRQSYKKSGGILYRQSLLTPTEFNSLVEAIDALNLKLTDEKSSSFATNRMGAVIEKDSDVYQILSWEGGSLCRLVNCLAEEDDDGCDEGEDLGRMILSPDIPIEIRIYEKAKAGMEWHVDDVIYQNTKQIEVVLTLENTSNCCTMWRPHDQPILTDDDLNTSGDTSRKEQENNSGNNHNKFRVESVQTTPNSAILIKAGSVLHKVSSLSYGRRVILKMAFVREGALMSNEMRNHVSHHNNGSAGKKNSRKKKKKR